MELNDEADWRTWSDAQQLALAGRVFDKLARKYTPEEARLVIAIYCFRIGLTEDQFLQDFGDANGWTDKNLKVGATLARIAYNAGLQ